MNKKISITIIILIVGMISGSCVKQQSISDEQPATQGNPTSYILGDKYPNPFSPNTTISYSVPDSVHVVIVIYNVVGETVDTVENRFRSPGSYEVAWDATGFTSGIYFYKLIAGDFTQTKKMVLLK